MAWPTARPTPSMTAGKARSILLSPIPVEPIRARAIRVVITASMLETMVTQTAIASW